MRDYKPEWEDLGRVADPQLHGSPGGGPQGEGQGGRSTTSSLRRSTRRLGGIPCGWSMSPPRGAVEYKAMLYIPAHAPFDFYPRDYQKGLQLYSSGVLIVDQCADLLPDPLPALSRAWWTPRTSPLTISHQDAPAYPQLKVIAGNLEKKIKAPELLKLQKDEREKYEQFWKAFGMQIKSTASWPTTLPIRSC